MAQTRLGIPAPATIIASAALAIVVAGVVAFAPTSAEAAAPVAPNTVSGTRSGQTITVDWDAVDSATKYNINHSNDAKRSWQRSKSNHSGTSYEIHGTWLNADYTFAVQACNASNQCSGWTNSNLVAGENTPNPPSVVHIKHHGSWVHFWWPKPHGGASKYDIVASNTNKRSWGRLFTGYRRNAAHIKNANDSKTYYVAIRACNHSGNNGTARACSGWRNSAAGLPPPPSKVGTVFAAYSGTDLIAEWPATKGATKYHSSYGCQPGQDLAFGNNHQAITGTSRTHNVSTDTGNTSAAGCRVSVRAGNDGGWSAWTDSAPAVVPPTAPSNVSSTTSTIHGKAGGTITTTWTAGIRATGYNVNYRADSGNWQRIASFTESPHTGTVTKDEMHTISVQSVGGSTWVDHRPYWLWVKEVTEDGEASAKMLAEGPAIAVDEYLYHKHNQETACKGLPFTEGRSLVPKDDIDIHAGQKYVYSLYSDSSCTNKLADAEFITLPAIYWYNRSHEPGEQVEIAFFGYNMQQNWSYKADAGPDATCKAPASNSVDLTGLTTGQEYTYTAYSGKTCGTQVAEVTFTAP